MKKLLDYATILIRPLHPVCVGTLCPHKLDAVRTIYEDRFANKQNASSAIDDMKKLYGMNNIKHQLKVAGIS